MRKVVLSLILVSILVGCPQEDSLNPKLHVASIPAKDYLPLKKGAAWTYVYHSEGNTLGDSTESIMLTEVVASGDQTIAQVESHHYSRFSDPTTNLYTYIKDPTGIMASYSWGIDTLVSFPLVVGTQSISQATASVKLINGVEWRHVLSDVDQTIEMVSTNWSEDCMSATRAQRWSFLTPTATYSGTASNEVVLAQNIGLVRRIIHASGQTSVQELATYSIPNR